jgi:hypothetical protein
MAKRELMKFVLMFQGMSQFSVIIFVGYILASLTTIGLIFENKPQAKAIELLRCVVFATMLQRGQLSMLGLPLVHSLQTFFAVSAGFWALQSMASRKIKQV